MRGYICVIMSPGEEEYTKMGAIAASEVEAVEHVKSICKSKPDVSIRVFSVYPLYPAFIRQFQSDGSHREVKANVAIGHGYLFYVNGNQRGVVKCELELDHPYWVCTSSKYDYDVVFEDEKIRPY